jgi:hypothetical protein
MSNHALKNLGIGTFEDLYKNPPPKKIFTPTNGVTINANPKAFAQVKASLVPILTALGDAGRWTTGSSGSWDEDHRFHGKAGSKGPSPKQVSGDIDVFLDTDRIKKKLKLDPTMPEEQVRDVIFDYIKEHFEATKITHVHVAFPAGINSMVDDKGRKNPTGEELPAFYQVDLFSTEEGHEVARHHEHDYSAKDSPYKGVDQQMAMSSLVNTIPGYPDRTWQYHGFGGMLKRRDANNTALLPNGKPQERNIDEIAKIILSNPQASHDDLGNVESMLAALPSGIDNPRLAQFRADMAKKTVPDLKEGSADWFKAMRQITGI